MRGRKPKERESYVLRMGDGSLVEVTREVYLEWYQSRRRERYQEEKKRKYGVCSLDRLEETVSAWRTAGLECSGLEESVVKEMCLEKLREGLGRIREQDAFLIRLLFFEEVTVKDAAWICGCSSRTVQNRRKRILGELRGIMEDMGITGGCF